VLEKRKVLPILWWPTVRAPATEDKSCSFFSPQHVALVQAWIPVGSPDVLLLFCFTSGLRETLIAAVVTFWGLILLSDHGLWMY